MSDLTDNNTRIKELDGLRGIAIFAAVVYHYANNLIDADASQFNLTLKSITHFFYTSIDMFFILSGFLLGGILLKNKNSPNYFKAFYMRRIFRIVPLYLLLLLLVFVICSLNIGKGTTWWYHPEIPFWVYFTFTQNLFMGAKDLIGNAWLIPTWSLGVEEQFYLLVSFLIYFSTKKTLIPLLLLGMIASPVFRYYAPSTYALSTFPFCRFDALFGGILMAVIYLNTVYFNFFKTYKNWFYSLSLLMFAVSFLFTIGKWQIELYWVNSWFSVIYMIVLLLVLTQSNTIFLRLAQIRFFIKLGLYSFSIYLFHEIILGLLFFSIFKKTPQIHSLNDIFLVAICALLTYFTAQWLYHNFETKFIAKGHRFKY